MALYSIYPSGIDIFIPKLDYTDDVMAKDVNELQEAIFAIETLLGCNSSGLNIVSTSGATMTGRRTRS